MAKQRLRPHQRDRLGESLREDGNKAGRDARLFPIQDGKSIQVTFKSTGTGTETVTHNLGRQPKGAIVTKIEATIAAATPNMAFQKDTATFDIGGAPPPSDVTYTFWIF